MAIKMHLIKTKFYIYGTYHKTICAHEHRYSQIGATNVIRENAIDIVKLAMFNYAMTFGTVTFIEHDTIDDWTVADVFNFIDKQTK